MGVDWLSAAIEELPRIACLRDATFESRVQRMGNCGVGITNLILAPTGQLKACLYLEEDECFGDLRIQTLEDVFNSPRVRALGELRAPGGASCAACTYEMFCMGCIVRGMKIVAKHKRQCRWAQERELGRAFPSCTDYPFQGGEGIFRVNPSQSVC
ncbi:MAG: SPASM domain-containing protein [Acidobacteriota bacterium]